MNEDNEHRKVCFGIRTVHTPWGESSGKSLSQPSQTQTWAVQVPLLERRDLLRIGEKVLLLRNKKKRFDPSPIFQ